MRVEAKRCDRGDAEACTNLGAIYEAGEDTAADPVAALALYTNACAQGAHLACINEAGMRRAGIATDPDPDRANTLLDQACSGGEPTACFELARALRQDGRGLDQARALFDAACDARILAGCRAYGQMLLAGEGGDPDPNEGLSVLARGCRNGAMGACYDEGRLYLDPTSPFADRERAGVLLTRACLGEEAAACTTFADALRDGPLAGSTDADATVWRQRACAYGDASACAPPLP